MDMATRLEVARDLMAGFAERTGIGSGGAGERYLWTDAFAVCNFLGLAEATGDARHRETALGLVEDVHHTLGRHRDDDPRTGWLSGPVGSASEEHPTRAGLRIGKPLPERGPDDPMERRLEWDRDGQYFHYLTKWMHALDGVARVTGEQRLSLWARELADAAHRGFVYSPTREGPPRMCWKMSIDLSRPLVSSMGQHDPLDGYVTTLELRQTAASLGAADSPALDGALSDYRAMIERRGGLATDDPLGLGGLLSNAHRLEQLMRRDGVDTGPLLVKLLEAARASLSRYSSGNALDAPASLRLAFRELGLAIGLHAVEHMEAAIRRERFARNAEAHAHVAELYGHLSLRDRIEAFWLDEGHRRAPTWTEHRNINDVMLATSLVPDGFLDLG